MTMKECFCNNNPWTKLDFYKGEYFALGDLEELQKKRNFALLEEQATLPEPFSGNPDSNVICLTANPGEKDEVYERLFGVDEYIRLTEMTLSGQAKQSLWYDLKDHSGYCWLRNITNDLRNDLGRNPDLFMIDYFPYHSPNTFRFPDELPSYEFTNQLIVAAIMENKVIIILRQKEKWEKRIKKIMQKELNELTNIYFINSNQNIRLSINNLGEKEYNIILNKLKDPLG